MDPIIELSLGSESRFLEFKQEYTPSMLKTDSAFANEHDGRIIFGVTDEGEPCEIDHFGQLRLTIENAINDSIQPRPFFEMEVENFNIWRNTCDRK